MDYNSRGWNYLLGIVIIALVLVYSKELSDLNQDEPPKPLQHRGYLQEGRLIDIANKRTIVITDLALTYRFHPQFLCRFEVPIKGRQDQVKRLAQGQHTTYIRISSKNTASWGLILFLEHAIR